MPNGNVGFLRHIEYNWAKQAKRTTKDLAETQHSHSINVLLCSFVIQSHR
jgi:hypothetical protein